MEQAEVIRDLFHILYMFVINAACYYWGFTLMKSFKHDQKLSNFEFYYNLAVGFLKWGSGCEITIILLNALDFNILLFSIYFVYFGYLIFSIPCLYVVYVKKWPILGSATIWLMMLWAAVIFGLALAITFSSNFLFITLIMCLFDCFAWTFHNISLLPKETLEVTLSEV